MFDKVTKQTIKFAETLAVENKPTVLLDKLNARDRDIVEVYYELMEEILNEESIKSIWWSE